MKKGETDAYFYLEDTIVKLDGTNNVIDLSFVVHKDEDDLGKGTETDSKTTGHAGDRLKCGAITLSASAIADFDKDAADYKEKASSASFMVNIIALFFISLFCIVF